MHYKHCLSLVACLLFFMAAIAQKPFTEGVIVYKVTIESPTASTARVSGTYICTIKDQQIKKEIKMNNGYQDVLIFNYGKKTVYSLQVKGDKKYAIQLKMDDFTKKQDKYRDFKLQDKEGVKKIAGIPAREAAITYPDSTLADLYYTPEWYPTQSIIFEHLPDTKVFPLEFTYDAQKGRMHFQAESIMTKPVENSVFHIPADYKMISYDEYLQLLN